MMSFVREKKWTRVGLSVVRRWPDNASAVSEKWREQKMSGNLSPEIRTSQVESLRESFSRVDIEPAGLTCSAAETSSNTITTTTSVSRRSSKTITTTTSVSRHVIFSVLFCMLMKIFFRGHFMMRLNVFPVQKWFSRVDRNTKDFTRN